MWLSSLTLLLSALLIAGQPQIRRPEAGASHPGVIEGKVHDSANTPLPGFSVVAARQQSVDRYGAVTNEAGEFRLEALPAGIYDVTVGRAGFPEVQILNVSVGPDSDNVLNPEVAVANTQPSQFRRPGTESPATIGTAAPTSTTPDPNAIHRPVPVVTGSGASGSLAGNTGETSVPVRDPFAIESPPGRAPSRRSDAPYAPPSQDAYRDFVPVRNRFDLELPPWRRYPSGPSDAPYVRRSIAPYNQNRFKGDYPIFGQRWFLDLTATSDSLVETRRLPAAGPVAQNTETQDFFSQGDQVQLSENLILTADLLHGLASFKPADFRIRVTPVLNGNYLTTNESGPANSGIQQRYTRSSYQLGGIEEGFVEYRVPVSSPKFDTLSVRLGTQTFISDFRGLIFNDSEPGIRVFGNLRSNRIQYNAAYFYMLEKDTNSLLNTFRPRNQDVLIANMYVQDFIKPGYATELSVHYDRDKPGFHIDKNGFLARPEPIGTVIPKSINAIYAGWAGDGHFGRMNITHAVYQVFGRERPSPLSGSVSGPLTGKINAQMAAAEISFDQDWRRYRFSAFYSSGDSNPSDNQSRGFDSIFDNVQFAGGDVSFWNRQGIRVPGIGVGLTQGFSLLPSLRTSKDEGQANFVNPGLYLINAGADGDLTPKLRASVNANLLAFAHTDVLEALLFHNHIERNIGIDTGMGFRWRPLLNQNVIIKFGGAALIPGTGFKQIYAPKTLFSTFTELQLTY